MKTTFSHTSKLAVLLSAMLSLSAWSADAVVETPVKSESIELTNLNEPAVADAAALPEGVKEEANTATKDAQRTAKKDTNTDANNLAPLPRKDDEGTSFSNVGLPGTVTAADFEKHGSPASYRELVLTNAVDNRFGNPNAMRRYLAVDRATYQARIGQ
jgi:hypothetical protein